MAGFVKTLQQKASRSHLRQSTVDSQVTGSGDSSARNPSNPNYPYSSHHASASSTSSTSTSSTTSLRFWRRQAPSPAPYQSPASSLVTLPESPKPILRREPSPIGNASNQGSVRFPTGKHPQRTSIVPSSYGAPPSVRRQSYLSSPQVYPARALSPTGSVRTVGSQGPRPTGAQYIPPSVAMSGGSSGHHVNSGPSGPSGATPIASAAPVASLSNHTYDPLSATGSSRYSIYDRRQSMYRASPPSSPYGAPRDARRTSSTPTILNVYESPVLPQPQQQAPAPQVPLRRPGGGVSNGSRRRSSRPSLPSSSRTRESITSLSSLKMGSSPSPSLSPASPTFPTVQLPAVQQPPALIVTPVMGQASSPQFKHLAFPTTSTLTTVPQSPESDSPSTPVLGNGIAMCPSTPTGSASPFASPSLASTPGGACPWSPNPVVSPNPSVARSGSIIRRRSQSVPLRSNGSPVPMFQVVPATPVDKTAPPVQLNEDTDAEEVIAPVDKRPGRVLDFGESDWPSRQPSPNLDDAISLVPGSPFSMATAQFGKEKEDNSRTPTPTTPAPKQSPQLEQATEAPVTPPRNPLRNTARVLSVQGPAPPKPAKHPARLQSLYDDGGSISRSLAELATIACDLPPFGAEMTAAAAEAAARLAAARAATDTPRHSPINSPHTRRAPPRAPPPIPPPPIPTNVAPFAMPGRRTSATPPPNVPRQPPAHTSMSSVGSIGPLGSLPPSPEFDSYPSLPSLVSHGSMPSNSSSVAFSSRASLDSTVVDPEEEAVLQMVRRVSTRNDSLTPSVDTLVSPATPKAMPVDKFGMNPGLGLGYDFSTPGSISPQIGKLDLGSPIQAPCSPRTTDYIDVDDFPLPPSPPLRIHRMSAAAANPNRAAFYGAASFLLRSAMNSSSSLNYTYDDDENPSAAAHTHTSQSSISSIGSMASVDYGSDVDEDEVLTASLVAFRPYAPAKYVVREDPRTQDVGVAF